MSTREKILKATERLIRKNGLSCVTTKQIAQEVGYAEGTLFNHFQDKSDLFLAVVSENLPLFVEVSNPDQAGTGEIKEQLKTIVLRAIKFYSKIVPLSASLLADTDLLMKHRATVRRRKGGPHHLFVHLADYIAAEQKAGRIRKDADPLGTAILLIAPAFQWALMRHSMGQNLFPMTDREYAELIVKTVLGSKAD